VYAVAVVSDLRAIRRRVEAWEGLTKEALEPNVFLEPWVWLAERETSEDGAPELLEIVHHSRGGSAELVGLLPIERSSHHRGLPISTLRSAGGPDSPLSTPLLHRDHAVPALGAFFEWAKKSSGTQLLELSHVAGDGPFHHLLVDRLRDGASPALPAETATRGMFRPRADGATYLAQALRGRISQHRMAVRREHLEALGPLEFEALGPGGDRRRWIAEFLALEDQRAKANRLPRRLKREKLFAKIAESAAERGRLMMSALRIAGRAIAMKCSLRSADGSFAFRAIEDQTYQVHSAGLLLEIENLRDLHRHTEIRWMDSCGCPPEPDAPELWLERRTIHRWLISWDRLPGNLVVALSPLAAWMARTLKKRPRRPSHSV
jgi:CelD/BcsL family acetyltransferase involved in cellulose biosynthesis